MILEIITPDKLVLKEEGVDEVAIPGINGQFGVLPGHTTFLSALGTGAVIYLKGGVTKELNIAGGFAEVRRDHVTVLADSVSVS